MTRNKISLSVSHSPVPPIPFPIGSTIDRHLLDSMDCKPMRPQLLAPAKASPAETTRVGLELQVDSLDVTLDRNVAGKGPVTDGTGG